MSKLVDQTRYQSIELLRFIAATAVVFVHIPIVAAGHFGVDVFFVISGFVMMLSTEKGSERFIVKRIIRIVPTYYIFTIGVFLVAILFPSVLNNTTANFEHLVKSLLFIPFDKNGAGHYPVLFLGWTLNYEMFFYCVFAVSLNISQCARSVVTSAIIMLIFFLCKNSNSLPFSAYGNLIVFEFVLGMVVYEALVKRNFSNVAVICFITVISALTSDGLLNERIVILGMPSAIFVSLMLVLLRDRELPRVFLVLGGASYSLYLTHPYVIQVFDKITRWFSGGRFEQAFALIISLALVNLLAVATYVYLERPTRNWLREKFI